MQRQKLRSLAQKAGESDSKYVKRVISVAKLCDYEDVILVEQVADAVQSHATNRKVRELARRILRKGGHLGELLEEVRAVEMDESNEEMYAKNHQIPKPIQVAAVAVNKAKNEDNRFGNQRYPRNYRRPDGNWRSATGRGFGRRGYDRSAASQQYRCWRCLSNRHDASTCWSIQQNCHNCQRMGHVARACRRTSATGPMKRLISDDDGSVTSSSKKVAIVKNDEEEAENPIKKIYQPKMTTFRDDNYSKVKREFTACENDGNIIGNTITESYECISSVKKVVEFNGTEVIIGKIAGIEIPFLIDSGADVNTIGGDTFEELMRGESSQLLCVQRGTDKPLKAYASSDQIEVIATFVAELTISDDRPRYREKFYVIDQARALLGRDTAIRYSVLQLGLSVPIQAEHLGKFAGEIYSLNVSDEFPRFNVPPVILRYNESIPPSRRIFTNIPPAFKAETERRIGDLLTSGIIERVTDSMDKSYCSSLLVVPKGKNDIRLVVDLRGPNKAIIRTPFKMPTLESILTDLPDCKWFSTIDLTSAFFHVVLDESSRHLTNFFAGDAMYRFQRLPFGLTNAPDIFQEVMQTVVLAECAGVRNYLDDVLVSGKTEQEHDKNLENVLRKLKEHNVRINREKCVFKQQSVKFIGFKLGHDGLRVEDEKLKAIRSFRKPETQQEVKSFLGLMNFTERFIPYRADKTMKLRELAKSDCFYWSESEEAEFEFLKEEALKTISKLGYFNIDDDAELYVDASPTGLGAVLTQFNSGRVPRVISCASKALTAAEMKYPQTQREALAMVWGIER
ncbi:uncharacterized protein LOC134202254 [Armigeres subalbatus]|uniref:uncharacterized protein LOC134202254 n=1 Tax=Armigeres subalbatus TaxID=124917 RepID=UPI002ED469C7